MEFNEFWQLFARKKQTIISLILVALIVATGIAIVGPVKYSSTSKVLVITETEAGDAYTLSRINEYFSKLISEVVYSGSFYSLVLANNRYQIDRDYFLGDGHQQLKTWQNTISAKNLGDTGIVQINVYHPNAYQAQQLSLAVNDVLINQGYNYYGEKNIKINIIDQPLVSNYPAKPNIPYLFSLALASALLLSLFYIYLFPEEKYDLKLWTKKTKKKTPKLIRENLVKQAPQSPPPVYLQVETNDNPNIDLEIKRKQLDEYYRQLGKQVAQQLENQSEQTSREKGTESWSTDLTGNIKNIIKN